MTTVFLSNLPVGCIESDIHRALLMYGTAVNVEMHQQTSQAVVTMRTQQEAQALLNRRMVNVIGTSVRVDAQPPAQPPRQPPLPQQHQALAQSMAGGLGYNALHGAPHGAMYTNMPPMAQASQQQLYQRAPQMYAPAPGGGYAPPVSPQVPPVSSASIMGGGGGAIMPAPPQTSRRLDVTVEDCRYPITRDVLMQMFSMIAPPVTVSCGPYGQTTTGSVEFAEAAAAQRAVDQFDGKAIYPECCHVKLAFAPMWEVPPSPPTPSVPTGFTAPPAMRVHSSATTYGGYAGSSSTGGAPAAPYANSAASRYPDWQGHPESRGDPSAPSHPRGTPPLPPASHAGQQGFGGGDGRREYVTGFGRGSGDAASAARDGLAVRGGRGAIRGSARGGLVGVGGTPFSPYQTSPMPAALAASTGPGLGGTRPRPPQAPDCAVLVSGVAESVPLYDLWVLLEVYGNVNSLKRQHSDHSHVVAQFQHPGDAVLAVQHLQNCPFRGQTLHLKRFLGYRERDTEWDLGPSTDPATLAALFDVNYHHRLAPHLAGTVHSGVYPCKNLFVTNLTEAVADYELDEAWRRAGFEPTASYRRGPKSAIVGFNDIETAVDALIAVHLRECQGRRMYITFSRFPPGPRPPRPEHGEYGEGEREERHRDSREVERVASAPPPSTMPTPHSSAQPPQPSHPTPSPPLEMREAVKPTEPPAEAAPVPAPKAASSSDKATDE